MCIVCGEPVGFTYTFPHGSFQVCDPCSIKVIAALRDKQSITLDARKIYKLSNNWGWALVELMAEESVRTQYGYGDRVRVKVLVVEDMMWITMRFSEGSVNGQTFNKEPIGSIPLSKWNKLHPVEVPLSDLPLYINDHNKSKYFDEALKGIT